MLKASHNIHYCKSLRDFTEIMPRFDLLSVSKVSNMIWEQHVSSLKLLTDKFSNVPSENSSNDYYVHAEFNQDMIS